MTIVSVRSQVKTDHIPVLRFLKKSIYFLVDGQQSREGNRIAKELLRSMTFENESENETESFDSEDSIGNGMLGNGSNHDIKLPKDQKETELELKTHSFFEQEIRKSQVKTIEFIEKGNVREQFSTNKESELDNSVSEDESLSSLTESLDLNTNPIPNPSQHEKSLIKQGQPLKLANNQNQTLVHRNSSTGSDTPLGKRRSRHTKDLPGKVIREENIPQKTKAILNAAPPDSAIFSKTPPSGKRDYVKLKRMGSFENEVLYLIKDKDGSHGLSFDNVGGKLVISNVAENSPANK